MDNMEIEIKWEIRSSRSDWIYFTRGRFRIFPTEVYLSARYEKVVFPNGKRSNIVNDDNSK